MRDKLLVAVIGNKKVGKTFTWNTLFRRKVKSGPLGRSRTHKLFLTESKSKYANVFLVSGSAEERKRGIGEIIGDNESRIVLCSIQYVEGGFDTLRYFVDRDFSLFVHWLNPGHGEDKYDDRFGLVPWVLREGGMIGVRDGNADAQERVREMRDIIHGWASGRGLIRMAPAVARLGS